MNNDKLQRLLVGLALNSLRATAPVHLLSFTEDALRIKLI